MIRQEAKMKRFICAFLIFVFLMGTIGCININIPIGPVRTQEPTEAPEKTELPADAPTDAPSEAPTEAPEETEAPTDEPEITDAPPAITGIADFCLVLEPEKEIRLDLDFDWKEDIIFIKRSKADEWDDRFDIEVTLGSDPEKPYTYTVDYCYDFYAWCVDCDPSDSRLEILVSFAQDSDDWTSSALRVAEGGGTFDRFDSYITISSSIDREFTSEGGFFVYDRTEIFGTYTVVNNMTVTKEGFSPVGDEFIYWNYPILDIELLKKFEVTLLNDDGSFGKTITLRKGDSIFPYSTDNKTWVIVELLDGRKAWISVEIHSWPEYDEWGVFLNGVDQNTLANIWYAD